MTPSTTSRNVKRSKLLRAVIPLAFWLGVWQLAAFLVDMRTNGHGALLLPYPLLVAQRLWALAGQGDFWLSAAVTPGPVFGGFAVGGVGGGLGAEYPRGRAGHESLPPAERGAEVSV